MTSGIFFRIERDGKWESIELESMTNEEIMSNLERFDKTQLLKVICILVDGVRDT